MRSRWNRINMMVGRVRNHLHDPVNEPLWHGQIPYLDTRIGEMESAADSLGIFGNKQSAPITGTTEQQNAAETALEEGANALGHLLHLYYRQQGNLAKAGEWKLTKTQWREMPEPALLAKANALLAEADDLVANTPTAVAPFGITPASVSAFTPLVEKYRQELGAPTDARADKKAMTAEMPQRYAELRTMLTDIDGMMSTLRDKSEAHRLMVDSYFAARRIGGHPGEDEENGATPPAPPTP